MKQSPKIATEAEELPETPARPFDLGFSHRERKDGSLEVLREGRQAGALAWQSRPWPCCTS